MRGAVDAIGVKGVEDDHRVGPVDLEVLAIQPVRNGIEEGRDTMTSSSANQGAQPGQGLRQEVWRKIQILLIAHQVFVEREQEHRQNVLRQYMRELLPREGVMLVAVRALGDVEMLAEADIEQKPLQPVTHLGQCAIMTRIDHEWLQTCFLEEVIAGLPAAILGRLLDERIITEENVEVLALRATGHERQDAVPLARRERDSTSSPPQASVSVN